MQSSRLFDLWSGYLVVSISGPGAIRLLNLTSSNNIIFWDLRYQEEGLIFKIKPGDFIKLRPLLLKTGCKAAILQKRGAPFLLWKGKRRKGLLLGLFLFCFLINFFSYFVWGINIEGNERTSKEDINNVLENYGVRKGSLKRNLNLQELERILLVELEELSWAGASLDGVYLEIQVVERLRESLPEEDVVELVAAKDGLVVDILVLAGEAVVQPGDTVLEGQLLISGKTSYTYLDDEGNEEVKEIWTRARGMVEAQVWYESYAEYPLHKVLKRKTGNLNRSLALVSGDNKYHLWGKEMSPYRNFELEIIKRSFAWRDIRFPVELISNSYWELEVEVRPVSLLEAFHEARERALEKINSALPRGVAVKKRFVEDYHFVELGKVGCRVLIETLEDIAVLKKVHSNRRDVSF